jgi:hypothetical protein
MSLIYIKLELFNNFFSASTTVMDCKGRYIGFSNDGKFITILKNILSYIVNVCLNLKYYKNKYYENFIIK